VYNPTGYTPTKEEVLTIVSAIERLAEKGTKVITVVDTIVRTSSLVGV
jgi:pyridoxal/pyridoxine/pyridoxamine kinase